MFEQYHGLVEHMVRRAGIEDRDVEDVTADLILKFMEPRTCPKHAEPKRRCRGVVVRRESYEQLVRCAPGGWLDLYDPRMIHQTASGPKQARFVTLLRRFVSLHVRQHLDRQQAHKFREALSVDALDEAGLLWLETFLPVEADVEESVTGDVALGSWVAETHEYLGGLSTRRGRRDLAKVFEAVMAQWAEDPGVRLDRQRLAREFQVSDTAAGIMLRDLRAALWAGGCVPEGYAS
jgi:hypothetical protein